MTESKKRSGGKNIGFAILLIGVFMAALDNGIISAALTTINSSFDVSATSGSWGITLYTLGLAVATPIVGKLADRYGRKKLFLIEVAIFTIGSLGVALSPNFELFLAARLFQSFGGGGIFIIASSHILSTFSKETQGSKLGLLGGMNGIASVIGPNIGSFLIDVTGNWHWLFLINLPIGVLLVVFGWITLQETKTEVLSKIDFLGISLLSFSILSVMFAVNNMGEGNLLDSLLGWSTLGLLLLGVVIFAVLIFVEKRHEKSQTTDPILPYHLLRKPTYAVTMVMGLLSGIFIGSIIFIPSYVEQILGISAAKSGYWMTPLAIASGIGAAGGGFFVDKQGPVKTLIYSGIISIIGFGGLGMFVDSKTTFIIFSVIAGIGFGFVLGAPLTVLTSNAAGEQKGSAIGTLSVARQVGLTISPTIFAAFIQQGFGKLSMLIPQKIQEHGIDPSQMPGGAMEQISGSGYANIQESIAKIPDPEVQSALHEAFQSAVRSAYEPIYLTTAGAAVLLIILVSVFSKKFAEDAREDKDAGQTADNKE
ncbi:MULTISPECIES: MFS transporter [Sporosarcina]|uniref:MFS transporter n=1 Tax=Sporosarcina TaxID=1569 RepID=UPI00129BE911|nr:MULTISPECIES: MFS transporter [Sporosarcina]GKV66101.1 putative MFS-type transporter YfiU [Sporosarcina sp. NCCP-2331]GLB56141.1 putative MFS-type transporter YfiU [Sporosarcina sp. NCCP-2378]